MDAGLVGELIERDWDDFVAACRRYGFEAPLRDGHRVDILVGITGSDDRFRAVLLCDGYDSQAPVLDFADLDGVEIGREHWPRMASAPMNSIVFEGRHLPILCVAGTRGYHLHDSHKAEAHPRSSWALPAVATILWRLTAQWGPYQGRGV